jgi:hypothetical protein
MIRTNPDALTCDFAAVYRVLDWRALPMRLAGTLAAGLGNDSRIRQAQAGVKAPLTTILLATAVDTLQMIAWCIGGGGSAKPAPIAPQLLGDDENNYNGMDADDFDAWRATLLEG